jgi:hypothetical protein
MTALEAHVVAKGPGLCQVLSYEIGAHLCPKREGGGVQCEREPGHEGGCWISEHTIRHWIAGNGYDCSAIRLPVEVGLMHYSEERVIRAETGDPR